MLNWRWGVVLLCCCVVCASLLCGGSTSGPWADRARTVGGVEQFC